MPEVNIPMTGLNLAMGIEPAASAPTPSNASSAGLERDAEPFERVLARVDSSRRVKTPEDRSGGGLRSSNQPAAPAEEVGDEPSESPTGGAVAISDNQSTPDETGTTASPEVDSEAAQATPVSTDLVESVRPTADGATLGMILKELPAPVISELAPEVLAETGTSEATTSKVFPIVTEVLPGVTEVIQGVVEELPVVSMELQGVTEELPGAIRVLPGVVEGLPVVTEGLPVVTVGLPAVTEGLPVVTEGLPVVTEGSPVISGIPSDIAQGLYPIAPDQELVVDGPVKDPPISVPLRTVIDPVELPIRARPIESGSEQPRAPDVVSRLIYRHPPPVVEIPHRTVPTPPPVETNGIPRASEWTELLEFSRLLAPSVERYTPERTSGRAPEPAPVETPTWKPAPRPDAPRASGEETAAQGRFDQRQTAQPLGKSASDQPVWMPDRIPSRPVMNQIADIVAKSVYRPQPNIALLVNPSGTVAELPPVVQTVQPTSAPVHLDPETLVADVREAVIRLASNGRSEARLVLHPPELGELVVRLESSKNGIVRVEFHTFSPLVREALEAGLNRLTDALKSEGLTLSQAEVHLDLQLGSEGEAGESGFGTDGDSMATDGSDDAHETGKSDASPDVERLPEGATISLYA